MLNKTERKKNWSTVSKYIKGYTPYRDPPTIKQTKDIFFGNAPLGEFIRSEVGLILLAEVSESTLDEFKESKENDQDNSSIYRELIALQNNFRFYFGQNSLLQRQEKFIFDYFQFVETDEFKGRFSEKFVGSYRGLKKKTINEYLDTSWLRTYLEKHTVPEHNQSWREIHRWEARLWSTPKDVRVADFERITAMNLMSIELVNRYPERFDPNIAALCKKALRILNSDRVPSAVSESYQKLISEKLDVYQQEYFVGSRVHVCVRYENECQLKASMEQLDPDTRYPIGANSMDEIMRHLTSYDGITRLSVFIINTLWEQGLVADKITIVDDKTFVFSLYMGTSYSKTCAAIHTMLYDTHNIEARYLSKKAFDGDARISDGKIYENSRVFEGLDGEVYASCDRYSKAVRVASNSWLSKLSSSKSNMDLAVELGSTSSYGKLRKIISDIESA